MVTNETVIKGIIAEAYSEVTENGQDFAHLSDLRRLTGDRVAPQDFDRVLSGMYRRQECNLVPQANQQALTSGQRAGALYLGGEDKHRMYWG
jgi:hypothetical protein